MRTFTRVLIPLLLAALLLAACPLSAAAAANATIAFSSSALVIGDTLTVTVNFSADTVGAVNASLSYDSAVLQFVSGDGAAGGGGLVKLTTWASSETSSLRFVLTFKALAAGSCTIQVTDSTVYAWDETLIGNPTAGATVKVTNEALSQNANLKSLQLSAGQLSPAFSPATTAYTVTVENRVTSLTISAIAADSGASVKVSGDATLPVGTTKRTITVTAPGGTTKVYTLTITRRSAPTTAAPTASATETETTTTTATPDDPTQEPCIVTYDDVRYVVAALPQDTPLPDGYTAGEITMAEQTVPAAQETSGVVALLWLTAADNEEDPGTFFCYHTTENLLFPYRPLATAGDILLLRPTDTVSPGEGLSEAEWELEGQAVSVWAFQQPEWAEFCVLYATDADGNTGFFRYDTVKKTVQRYIPLTASTTPVDATTATTATAATKTDEQRSPAGWTLLGVSVAWLTAGVLALVCIALAVLAVIFYRRSLTPPKH